MCELNPCESCWCNCCGNCNGLSLLVCCCGVWCCKGSAMERIDPNFCYCFEQAGLGCNVVCLGFTCWHPIWFTLYVRQQFPTQIANPNAYPQPYNNNIYPPTPRPNPFNSPYNNPTPNPYNIPAPNPYNTPGPYNNGF